MAAAALVTTFAPIGSRVTGGPVSLSASVVFFAGVGASALLIKLALIAPGQEGGV